MVPRETSQFCFPVSPDVSRDEHFPLNNHIAKANEQSAVRDTFDFDQGNVTKNQQSQCSFC